MVNPLKIKLSRNFIIRSYLGILGSGLMYILILPFILNLDSQGRFELITKLAEIIPVFGFVCVVIFYILYRPAEAAIIEIDRGIIPSEEKILKARKSLSTMDLYYITVGITFYPLGTVANILISILHHEPVAPDMIITRLVSAVVWGLAIGVLMVRINNITLIPTKLKLNIYHLDKSSMKYQSVFRKFFFPFLFLLLLSLFYSSILYYHLSKENIHKKDVQISEVLKKASSGGLSEQDIKNEVSKIEDTNKLMGEINFSYYIMIMALLFGIIIIMFVTILYEYQCHVKNLIGQIDKLSSDNMDLSGRINIISYDDIGIMTAGINKIIMNLHNTFKSIKISSMEVDQSGRDAENKIQESRKATSDISPIISGFEINTDSQIDFIKSTVNQFKEMLVMIENSINMITRQVGKVMNTSDYVKDMIKAFDDINNNSMNNIRVFNDLINSIEDGNQNIAGSIESIRAINDSGKKINEIADIITEISSQTNLLSMNAAIEAANAGKYGKGFSVVAVEIRKLSETTSKSARGISTIIKEMNEKIRNGSDISIKLKNIFDLMVINMNKTRQSLNNISVSTKSHSEKAMRNLGEINELLEITNQLKDKTENLGRDSKNIENSILLLNTSSENLKTGNVKLTGEIKHLIRISEEVSRNFKVIFDSIRELDNKISLYKTE